MTEVRRAGLAARAFALAALVPLAALVGAGPLRSTLLVAAVSGAAAVLLVATPTPGLRVAVGEAAVVAVVVVAGTDGRTVAPYLVVPVVAAALEAGRRAVLVVVGVEALALVAGWLLLGEQGVRDLVSGAALWLAAGAGVGWLAAVLRRSMDRAEDDAPYRNAVALIRRLDALSGRLSGGLDAVTVSEQVMDLAEEVVPLRSAGVFVRQPAGTVVPVRYLDRTEAGSMDWAVELAGRCWVVEAPTLRGRRLALPLQVDGEVVAVLALEGVRAVPGDAVGVLRERLARSTVQLQAALLFGRVRETATTRERQRIAREVHDGVAQDVAGLGYLVDNLAVATPDESTRRQLTALRDEVSRVVTELRFSVFDLRQEHAVDVGLGEEIAAYAHQVSGASPMAVHVTLDEEGPRLPRDQEFELMRIAQEAMTNARKHSGAENLWVRCTVRAPAAEVEVADDGTRTHRPARDSQGLAIMRERAEAIGAEIEVLSPGPARVGTRVRVRVGGAPT